MTWLAKHLKLLRLTEQTLNESRQVIKALEASCGDDMIHLDVLSHVVLITVSADVNVSVQAFLLCWLVPFGSVQRDGLTRPPHGSVA
jgi:hypothetical protein